MSVGVRELTVLGEFKPFGLVAESLDGIAYDLTNNYDYSLFDPETVKQRDSLDEPNDAALSSSDRGDHELFIRENRIIWSTGSRVHKRLTLTSPVIKACWCRMGDTSEALLCVLQVDRLTLYNTSGEVVSLPLHRAILSVWPLPFGLLLQQATEVNSLTHASFSSSSPLLNARDIYRPKKELGMSPSHNYSSLSAMDNITKSDEASSSSHLILKHPLEEPQSSYIQERGKFTIMKDFDERTIWSSDYIPLMASFNKGKMQHSLWVAEVLNSNLEVTNSKSSDVVPPGVLQKQFIFRRIWQGKGAQTAASEVFLATDDDATPIVCFLLQEQKKLLSVRLQSTEINNEILFDVKSDLSWSIQAIVAAPVVVTRPRVKLGLLPVVDIITLVSENMLLLYSGRQCLCRYVLPTSFFGDLALHNLEASEALFFTHDSKIVGLADAVESRINIVLTNGKNFRCTLRRSPSSSLADDCITAMAEGIMPSFYKHFMVRLWGDPCTTYLMKADSGVDSEWESFCCIVLQMCKESKDIPSRPRDFDSQEISSWEFLINSKFHKIYKHNFNTEVLAKASSHMILLDSSGLCINDVENCEKEFYIELLLETLDCLHAVYETLKLDNLRRRDLALLVSLLCNIAYFLGKGSYLDYYIRDFPGLAIKFRMEHGIICLKAPPSLLRWLESCLQRGCSFAKASDLPSLIHKNGNSVVRWARKIISFYSLLCGSERQGKKLSTGVICDVATGSYSNCEELTILAMVGEGFGLKQLDLLPAGVSLPLRHALDICRESPPTDWPAAAYILIGREDLAFSCSRNSNKSKEHEPHNKINLVSMSTPYMLNLHTVTIPLSIFDATGLDSINSDDLDSDNGSVFDGMEHIFNSSSQLRYGRDLRLNEVRRLLCSARPVSIQTPVNPTASDQDLQQAQLWQFAQRTTAIPFGRGAFTLATTHTLLTETLTVPKLVLAGRLPAQQNATVNLDPNIRNIQELRSWPEFHNAVAAGLKLAPLQGKMSRTWILYNKPEEPNVVHAGLLLALGLHGHLRILTITDIYQYYSQEHESTTVGLMLGLAASYRGTMQPAISKSLFVHIPARHPSSFPELELPTVLQSAALVSLGLLYEGSAHPQTMQILLGEIGRRSGGDNVLEREGYAISAGFSLGLVALGRGEDALGFMDALVDRLFQYIFGKEFQYERSFSLTTSTDEQNWTPGQVIDGNPINIDVTAPAAIIALSLMYLKTESEVVLSRLRIPDTHFDLQYVRPDFIMLRVIARNLIMWNRIQPSQDWIQSQVPEIIKAFIKGLADEFSDIDEMEAEAFIQAYVNIITGACTSLGLRYAGTKDDDAQELLYSYALYFLNEIRHVSAPSGIIFPKGLTNCVDRSTLETCLHLVVLSLSVVMAGSGHLRTLRLLKFLRNRNSVEGHFNYGTQMAVSLAIGFLFLGGGMRTFSTTNGSIAALLITLFPRFQTGPNDNRCHLQAFRHLYVLATEARWIQTLDVDTGLPVYAPLEVTIRETEHYAETSFCEVSPCILPERAILKTVRVCGPRYWPQVKRLVHEDKPWWNPGDKSDPFNSGVIYIKRRVGACSYVDDSIGCQSLLSRAMHKVFGLTSLKTCIPSTKDHIAAFTVDQLVSTFSSDPSLIAFAQLCSDQLWNNRSDIDFHEFCLQVLFECVSKDRPALLQVYLSLYTIIGSMADHISTGSSVLGDSIFISSLKLALAYNEALLNGRLTTSRGSIVQSTFLGSLRKRVDEMLCFFPGITSHVSDYLTSGKWPNEDNEGKLLTVVSWYLQWYCVPPPSQIKRALEKVKPLATTTAAPLLRLLFPGTHINAIAQIDRCFFSSQL